MAKLAIALIISLVLLCPEMLHTQSRDSTATAHTAASEAPQQFWLSLGFGGGNLAGKGAPSFGGIATLALSSHSLLSIRFAYIEEFKLCIFGPCSTPPDYLYDVGALYGIMSKEKWWYAGTSAGVGVVGVRVTSNTEQKASVTIGALLDGQAFFTPLSFLGIGIYGYANVNPQQSFFGALLCLQVGSLR